MLPSLFTTNCTVTRPWVPFSCGMVGYLIFLLKYCKRPTVPPLRNCGFSSTTSKISSSTGTSSSTVTGMCFTTTSSPVSSEEAKLVSSTLASSSIIVKTSLIGVTWGGGGGATSGCLVRGISMSCSNTFSTIRPLVSILISRVHSNATNMKASTTT